LTNSGERTFVARSLQAALETHSRHQPPEPPVQPLPATTPAETASLRRISVGLTIALNTVSANVHLRHSAEWHRQREQLDAWLSEMAADEQASERRPVPRLDDVTRKKLRPLTILRSARDMLEKASTQSTKAAETLKALTSVVEQFSAVSKGLNSDMEESIRRAVTDRDADANQSSRHDPALETEVAAATTDASARLRALLETVLALDHQLSETSVEQFLNAYGPTDGG
jgi:hypothetical protein